MATVTETPILRRRLAAVAGRTHRLPSAAVPEQFHVATMRVAMIDDVRGAVADDAKRIHHQERQPCLSPRWCRHQGQRGAVAVDGIIAVAAFLVLPARGTMNARLPGHNRVSNSQTKTDMSRIP